MKLIVQNVMRYESLELEIDPGLTLITGKNAAGKTSLAKILATLTSGKTNPSKFAGTQFKYYIRKGAMDGIARLDVGEDGYIEWQPKTGLTIPEGINYPFACEEAVNLVDFTTKAHGPQARAAMWEGLLAPGSPEELLRPVWEKAGRPIASFNTLVNEIEKSGWKGAGAIYQKKRAGAKSEWQLITGAGTWGGDKAAKWVPHNWDSSLEDESLESLEAQLVNARDNLNSYIVQAGIDQAAIDAAAKLKREQYDPAVEALKVAEENLEKDRAIALDLERKREQLDKELETKRVEHDRLEVSYARAKLTMDSAAPLECPECHAGLHIPATNEKSALFKWEPPTDELRKKAESIVERSEDWFKQYGPWREKAAKSRGSFIATELSPAVDAEREAEGHVRECKATVQVLEPQIRLAGAEVQEAKGSEVDRQHAEVQVEEAAQRIRMWKQWTQATRAHENVVEYEYVCKLLGSTGVRTKLLDNALVNVNKLLANINTTAGWPELKITPAYDVMLNDWPLQAATAESELLRTQWAMQIVFARHRKSDWLILDQGDHLQDEAWDGLMVLMGALAKSRPHMHIILCSTSTKSHDLMESGSPWQVIDVDEK